MSPADRERHRAESWDAVLTPSLSGGEYAEAVYPWLLADEVVDAVRVEGRPREQPAGPRTGGPVRPGCQALR